MKWKVDLKKLLILQNGKIRRWKIQEWLSDTELWMKIPNVSLIGASKEENQADKKRVIFEGIVWRDNFIELVENEDSGPQQRE